MILPPEHQVSNLALSQRMKELDFPQESYFFWFPGKRFKISPEGSKVQDIWMLEHRKMAPNQEHYSAYTVAEIICLFPRHVTIQIRNNRPDETRLMVEIEGKWLQEDGGTTADTLSTMAIYLAENGLLDVTSLGKNV